MARGFDRRHVLAVLGLELAACSLDSDVSVPNAAASAPINGTATLSGGGALGTDPDAAVGFGDDSVIADFGGDSGDVSTGAASGGTDGGSAAAVSTGGDGGATTTSRGGAAAAGGSAAAASGSAGSAGSVAMPGPPPLLFFSEYVEGSSSNKALEISAQNRAVLDGCKVGTYFNGKSDATVVATLSGTLESGRVLTLCTSTLQAKLPSVCNQVGNLTFNGNDAVALSCEGKLLDVIGQIGVDPGTGWGNAAVNTADHTLRRKCSVAAGDSNGLDAFDPSGEWQALPADTYSGLGSRGC